jgi:hypothetical protein
VRVIDQRDPCRPRCYFFQELKPLAPDRRLENREPGDVPTRAGQIRYESLPDRIDNLKEHNWDDARLLH